MSSFEEDVFAILNAHGDESTSTRLYRELRERDYDYNSTEMKTKLEALPSISYDATARMWNIIDGVQGAGEPLDDVEAWVRRVPELPDKGTLPVKSSTHEQLPFERLTWENFEALCCRLLQFECHLDTVQYYGTVGQDQRGIDIKGRTNSGEYRVVQCKRYTGDYTANHVKRAVDRFLGGKWTGETKQFILAVTKSMQETSVSDEIEQQTRRLKEKGYDFVVWDQVALHHKLLERPLLITDFFGDHWCEHFNRKDPRKEAFVICAAGFKGAECDTSQALLMEALHEQNLRLIGESCTISTTSVDDVTDKQAWSKAHDYLKIEMETHLGQQYRNHSDATIALFPLARVSLLFCIGMSIPSTRSSVLFRWDRDEKHWRWKHEFQALELRLIEPRSPSENPQHVAVSVSLSPQVRDQSIMKVMKQEWSCDKVDLWKIQAADGTRGYNNIHHPNQLGNLVELWRNLLEKISEIYGDSIDLHLFTSAGAPAIVSLGQNLHTRCRPTIQLYEYDGEQHHVLTV